MTFYIFALLLLVATSQATRVRNFLTESEKLELAQKYFQPLISDELINPDMSKTEFISSKFYSEPLVHPFDSDADLVREVKRDPFGFASENYRSSFIETRMLQAEYERTRSTAITRTLGDMFGEGKRVVRNVEKTLPLEKGGHKISLNYDVTFVRGLVSLEAETDSVESLECPSSDKLIIHIKMGKLDTVTRWIPGTRFILSPENNCYSNGENKPAYVMMVRRHKISDTIVEYDVKEITEQDCYMASKIDFEMTPNEDLLRSEMERLGTFKDTSMLGSSFTSTPAYQTMWLAEERKSRAVARHSVDETRSLDLLNFNYDRVKGRASQIIDFYKTSNLAVQCTNCYAWIGFNFRFRMDTTFVWINVLEATVEGNAKFAFETKLDFSYGYKYTWNKTIFTKSLALLRFAVGPIPVSIDPVVTFDGQFDLDIKAKLRVTHAASFEDRLKLGIKYENKQLVRINTRKGPTFLISAPKISDDSAAELNAKLTLMPRLTLKFYSLAPLDITVLPYVRLNAKVGNAACGRYGASYNSYWGLSFAIQLQKLTVPTNIFGIGGKEFDLSGLLPFPKIASQATYVVVPDSPISCKVCSGCVNLAQIWSKRDTIETVPSFLEASSQKREILGDDTPTDIQLGKSVYSNEIPAYQSCHLYRTSSLDEALPANDVFVNADGDSRKSLVSMEVFSLTGATPTPLKIYHASTLDNLRDTIAAGSNYDSLISTLVLEKNWQNIYFGVCNAVPEASSSLRYSFQSKPIAEINMFNIASPTLQVKNNSVVQLRFKDAKKNSHMEGVIFSKKQISGHNDVTTHLYALSEQGLIYMDSTYLVQEDSSPIKEVDLTSTRPHNEHDYMLTADIFATGESTVSEVICQVNGIQKAKLRSPVTLTPIVNLVEVQRGDSAADEIWQYSINVVSSEAVSTKQVCFYTKQRVNIDAQDKICHTFTDQNKILSYVVPADTIQMGYDFFMIEIVGDHTVTSITVDEHIYVRSGTKMFFKLKGSSRNGDRFVLYRDEEVSEITADSLYISGKTYSKSLNACEDDCGVTIQFALVEFQANGEMIEKWRSESLISELDGTIRTSVNFDEIKKNLTPTDAEKVKTFRVVIDVIGEIDDASKFYELWVDEIVDSSIAKTQFTDRVTMSSSIGEIMYYRIPQALISHLGGGIVAKIHSLNANMKRDDTTTSGIPQLYLQKGSLPRLTSFMKSAYKESSEIKLPIFADGDSDYYLGVTTQSQELNYALQLEDLPPAKVSITYFIDGAPSKVLTIDAIKQYGLTIKFSLDSEVQSWSPSLTDPATNTCRKLLAIFSANSYKAEWSIIQQHMINTLEEAFSPNAKNDPSSFITYEEKKITLKFPPFKIGDISLTSDMIVNADKNLDKEFFTSEDTRITVANGGQFAFEKNASQWHYILIPIIAGIVFLFFTAISVGVVALIIYKSVVESKKKLKAPSLPISGFKETLLENEMDIMDLERDVSNSNGV